MSFDISNLNAKVDLADGEWIDDIPDHPGLRLRVRSARYKPYRVALSAFYRDGFEQRIARLCFAKKDETLALAIERLQKI